ncbi:MAG TPA: hypothetical protein VFS39_05805, partial [Nitrospira sp.]|nr:hypothetical protein [Nitrospira sp.]
MRTDKRASHKADKKTSTARHRQGVVGYSKKSALLEEAITYMNAGKYGRSSATLKELLALDPQNTEARRLFATLHLRLGSLVTAREAFEALANEAIGRQDYWLAESLLREYLAAGPRCIPFLEQLARVYEDKGDAMAAVGELGKALEILLEDPDPDNPKKPAELYSRIRELAPASPVAFQFASFFDIQTGEFRAPLQSSTESTSSSQFPSTPLTTGSNAGTDAEPEVMPWEQLDGDSLPSRSLSTESSTLSAVSDERLGTLDVSALPGDVPPVSLERQPVLTDSIGYDESANPPAPLPVQEEAPPASELPVSPQPPQISYEEPGAAVLPGPTAAELAVSEPSVEPREETEAPEASASLPSRMPWEHVADASLQILEAAPVMPAEVEPASLQPDASQSDASIEQASHLEPDLKPSVPVDDTDVPASPPTESAIEDVTRPAADEEPLQFRLVSDVDAPEAADISPKAADSPSVASTPESDPSTTEPETRVRSHGSFSWKEIFDSAWKFTSNTTAPALSAPNETFEAAPIQETNDDSQAAAPPEQSSSSVATVETTSESLAPAAAPGENMEQLHSEGPTGDAVKKQQEIVASIEEPDPSPEAVFQIAKAVSAEVEPETPAADGTAATASTSPSVLPVPEPEADPPQPLDLQAAPPSVDGSVTEPAPETIESPTDQSAVIEPDAAQELLQPPSPAASTSTAEPASTSWNTGEVAVQRHRPAEKKRRWEPEPDQTKTESTAQAPVCESSIDAVPEVSAALEATNEEPLPAADVAPSVDDRPDWAKASDSIVLEAAPPAASPSADWQAPISDSFDTIDESEPSAAATAVDVLFGPSGKGDEPATDHPAAVKRRPRFAAPLARLRQGVTSFIVSGFSTTRAFVLMCLTLLLLSASMAAVGIGMVALLWLAMEEPPSQRYQSLTTAPQRAMSDPRKNGFLLLLGFDAASGIDAAQAGYERKPTERDLEAAEACMSSGDYAKGSAGMGAAFTVVDGWFKTADPLSQLKSQSATLQSALARESASLARYQEWLSMSFEDWSFGQMMSPNCPHIVFAHRLFLLEGFAEDTPTGLGRLEKDMEAWRVALGQSKSLMMKMLAATAVQDNALLASALLMRQEVDANTLHRLSKIVRPLDQVELSVRWPMQSYFTWAMHSVSTELKNDRTDERPFYVSLAARMPLPVQRRANEYAEYYDAANRAVAEGRYVNLPKPSQFVRSSASTPLDYLANPIEHLIGIAALPSWDPYVGRMVETDARLRLASLQAWVRRGPQDADVLARLAKAGQAYYDPFTGLPMLVNQQKRLLYSVGRDGKDQEGDSRLDVAVAIPSAAPLP